MMQYAYQNNIVIVYYNYNNYYYVFLNIKSVKADATSRNPLAVNAEIYMRSTLGEGVKGGKERVAEKR